jgi:hypothetical protein
MRSPDDSLRAFDECFTSSRCAPYARLTAFYGSGFDAQPALACEVTSGSTNLTGLAP